MGGEEWKMLGVVEEGEGVTYMHEPKIQPRRQPEQLVLFQWDRRGEAIRCSLCHQSSGTLRRSPVEAGKYMHEACTLLWRTLGGPCE